MSRRRSDESFEAFARTQRHRLAGAAVLLGATQTQADDLVGWALASTYPRWSRAPRPDLDVVVGVLDADPGVVTAPWRRAGVELLDGPVAPSLASVPAALQRLPRQQRIVVVARDYLGLSESDLVTVTGLDPVQLRALTQDAHRQLGGGASLPGRLTAAVAGRPADEGPTEDLAHGRWVVRRRRLRTLLVAAVALVVLGLLSWQFRPTPAPVSAPVPDPVVASSTNPGSDPTPSATACDPSEPRCQVQLTRAWRSEMATLVATALDPEGRYFTGGFSYAYDDRFDSYWDAQDGALGLNLLARDGSATQVFLQIATSRGSAVRCGLMTDHTCERQKFLDGNWFTVSDSVDVQRGMEVQYRPDGDQVITVIARNTTAGRSLDIGRGDLIALVQDTRLRLPER